MIDIRDIHQDKPIGDDSMPLQQCTEDGKPCWRWGNYGRAYPFDPDDPESEKAAKRNAIDQGLAEGEGSLEKCNKKPETEDDLDKLADDKKRKRDRLDEFEDDLMDDLADEEYLNRTLRIRNQVRKSWEAPIIKANSDQRIVYGVVSEPYTIDLQGDRLSPDEIEKAAHAFMVNSRKVNKGHGGPVAADVLESFIAPGDFVVNGQTVRKGSWVMGVRVRDNDLWQSIKNGEVTGFSIGGRGRRVPLTSQS